jgi:hypothetical protein
MQPTAQDIFQAIDTLHHLISDRSLLTLELRKDIQNKIQTECIDKNHAKACSRFFTGITRRRREKNLQENKIKKIKRMLEDL